MSSQPLSKELEELKAQHERVLREQLFRAVAAFVSDNLTPTGIEQVVDVAVGLDRRPILASVLESYAITLRQGVSNAP